jgi:putative tricarboxylic transport membrane protein
MITKRTVLALIGVIALSGFSSAQKYQIMAPCTSGCSWDVLARAVADDLVKEGLAESAEVYNAPGGGGSTGLQQFAKLKGDPTQLFAFGIGAVGGVALNKTPLTLADLTPIARLAADHDVVYVAASSPYKTLGDLIAAWKEKPESIIWGGSSAGSTSHMMAGLIAQAIGVNPAKIKFVPSSGNLQGAKAAIQGEITAGTGSYASFEPLVQSGQLRLLGISAARRDRDIPVPTLIEQGVNVEFTNWRGIAAPAGITPRERAELQLKFSRLARSASWRASLESNNWNSYLQTGESFRLFLEQQQGSVQRLLESLQIIK